MGFFWGGGGGGGGEREREANLPIFFLTFQYYCMLR